MKQTWIYYAIYRKTKTIFQYNSGVDIFVDKKKKKKL